jgi:hypothetical protein
MKDIKHMTSEELLNRYERIWNRVKKFNDIKYMHNPKRKKLWRRAADAWADYIHSTKKAPADRSTGA